jgi:hypothetical protein
MAFAGCASPAHLTQEESQRIVETARQIVLNEPGLGKSGKSEVQNSEPKLSCYFIARPQAQYSIGWNLASSREDSITGTGDVFTLAGGKITLSPK